MSFCKVILDDFRFIKNKELWELVMKLSLKKLKELNNPKFFFLPNYFDTSAVIDTENIQYVHAYIAIFEEKTVMIKGCVVTDIFFPKVKTLDDLLKAFTSNEHQKFNITNVSSFYYKNVEQTFWIQFASTSYVVHAIEYIHQAKGERLFNVKTQMFDSNKIYIAYQKLNSFEHADIIDFNCFHPLIPGKINIDSLNNNKKSSIAKHWIFHSKKHNNKQYERLV